MKSLPIIHFLFGLLALFLVLELVDWFMGLVFLIPFATAVASVGLIRQSRVGVLARVQLVMTLLALASLLTDCAVVLLATSKGPAWPVLLAILLQLGVVLPWFLFTVFHGMEVLSRRESTEGGYRPGLLAHAVAAVTLTASCAGIAGGFAGVPEFFTIVMMGVLAFLVASIAVFLAGRTAWFRGLPAERQRSSLWLLAANASMAVLLVPVLGRVFGR